MTHTLTHMQKGRESRECTPGLWWRRETYSLILPAHILALGFPPILTLEYPPKRLISRTFYDHFGLLILSGRALTTYLPTDRGNVPTGFRSRWGHLIVNLLGLRCPDASFRLLPPLSSRRSSLPATSHTPTWCPHRRSGSPSSRRATLRYTFRSSDGPRLWAGPDSRFPSIGVSLSAA